MADTWTPAAIAREMKSAQDARLQIEPFTDRLEGFDSGSAYAVARLIHEERLAAGAIPVGRKIGFTNRNIWPEYGVYEPIWAHVYDTTVTYLERSTGTCTVARFADPRIEPEIVLHFRTAPPETGDPAEILRAIDWIAHGIEIVQSNFPDWRFQAADTIADSSLHGALFVGEPRTIEELGSELAERLRSFTITLSCNGETRDRGCGANVLDSPLSALAHLVSILGEQKDSPAIAAGELVTTGTLTRALPVRPGEKWSTRLEGLDLPGITLTFT